MILAAEQVVFPAGSKRTLQAIDLRSRRLKALTIDDAWQGGDLNIVVASGAPDDLISSEDLLDEAGNPKTIASADADVFYMLDPHDMEGIDWLMLTSDTEQGSPAGFAVVPNTTDFHVAPAVTFTVTVVDGSDGVVGVDHVSLSAAYADVDALVSALAIKSPSPDSWTNNAGAVTAEYVGNIGSYIDVTQIVDGSDKMNFSSISGFAFPGYQTDVYVTLTTEPRT